MFITSTSALLVLTAIGGGEAIAKSKSPNVIFILADDLGYGDLSCYGQKNFSTPYIDAMARGGVRFTQFYAGCTVSAPSRCALMTGKHTGNTYVRGNRSVKGSDGEVYDTPIPDGEYTLAELFKDGGYKTACVGKWGLGGIGSSGHPNAQGFDYFFGCLGQAHAHRYFPTYLHENSTRIELGEKVYSHDLMEAKALDFITENRDNPFFLYLSFTIPHAELNIPDEYTTQFEGKFQEPEPFMGKNYYSPQDEPYKVFASMVTRLDRSVGTILERLKELGIDEDTMVIFTSDNGAHAEGGANPEFFNSTGIYRGIKRDLYEGGIRVPMIINYPRAVAAGRESDLKGAFWDFMPTFQELIGLKGVSISDDGLSIMPTLEGKRQKQTHDYLYWEFHERTGSQAIRMGDWKLIRQQWKGGDKAYFELFNIALDPSEESNVADANEEVVSQMLSVMDGVRTPSKLFKF